MPSEGRLSARLEAKERRVSRLLRRWSCCWTLWTDDLRVLSVRWRCFNAGFAVSSDGRPEREGVGEGKSGFAITTPEGRWACSTWFQCLARSMPLSSNRVVRCAVPHAVEQYLITKKKP